MVGDKSKKKSSDKDKAKNDNGPDTQKVREESLTFLKGLGMPGNTEDKSSLLVVALEVDTLQDGAYKQFTQFGAALTDEGKKQVSFFRSIIPRFMEDYNHNLILKHQNNLRSSLGMKYDEQLNKYLFVHKKKGEDVEPVGEEKALTDILGFLRSYCREKKAIIFMHSKETFLPLLLAKLDFYKMTEDFEEKVAGFCDFSSLMAKLKVGQICKNAKFADILDVYKQVIGKAWPKDVTHKDGITSLSDNCVKKLVSEITAYLDKSELKLNKPEFFKACGLQSFEELKKDDKILAKASEYKEMCRHDQTREAAVEVELMPSDRPGEVTIVTLKRFECIDVMDLDEVEEEGIKEDEFFESDNIVGKLVEDVTIKPGFVATASILLVPNNEAHLQGNYLHALVSKNPAFGTEEYINSDESRKTDVRLIKSAKCVISRQIVEILKSSSPVTDSGKGELTCKVKFVIQVKILNPLDFNIDLKKDDVLVNSRVEKLADPDNPDYQTYTMIKQAKALENAKKHDDMLRENGLDKPIKTKKKGKRKKKKGDKSTKNKDAGAENSAEKEKGGEATTTATTGGLSFDFDALDFEPVNTEDEEDKEDKQEDEVSLSDMSEASDMVLDPVSEGEEEEDEEKGEKKEDAGGTTANPVIENDDANTTQFNKSLIIADDSVFYKHKFFGVISNATGGIHLSPCAISKVCLKINPAIGFNENHMIGRKCCVKTNADFSTGTVSKRNDAYKFEGMSVKTRIETVKRNEKGEPVVNAFIQNSASKAVFYPNGINVAWVTFFVPKDVSMDEVSLPPPAPEDLIPPGEEREEQLIPPGEEILKPLTPPAPNPPGQEVFIDRGLYAKSTTSTNSNVGEAIPNLSLDSCLPPGEEGAEDVACMADLDREDLDQPPAPPSEADLLPSPVPARRKRKPSPATPSNMEPKAKKLTAEATEEAASAPLTTDTPTPPMPSREQISKLTVKVLKNILTTYDVNTSGLKLDLVKRVEEFYTSNRDCIDEDLFRVAVAVSPTKSSAAAAAAPPSPPPVSSVDKGNAAGELVNFTTSGASVNFMELTHSGVNKDASPHQTNGSNKISTPPPSSCKSESDKAVDRKLAEMKAMDSIEIKFHDRPHYISLKAPLHLERPGKNVVTVKLPEIEIFFNDLSDRRVSIRRDDDGSGGVKIRRQVCKVTIDGRIPMVDILIESQATLLEPMHKFFKIYIERMEKDGGDQFNLPQEL